jgi:two-component system sensor histidine kinase/response regulator
MKEKQTVVVLDDEPHNNESINGYLRRDYNVVCFTRPYEALEYVKHNHLFLIIADQRMPVISGLDFLNQCKIIKPNAINILVSAYVESDKIKESLHTGTIFKFIPKPIDWVELDKTIELSKAVLF